MRKTVAALAAGATVAAIGLAPFTFAESGGGFSCRASVVRIQGEGKAHGLGTIEPIVANSSDAPCNDDSQGLNITPEQTGGLLDLHAIYANTSHESGSSANAESGVVKATINLGVVAPGAPPVTVKVLTSEAHATCDANDPEAGPALSGEAHVASVKIGDQTIEVPPRQNRRIQLGPLGTLVLDEQNKTGTSITERALDLTVNDPSTFSRKTPAHLLHVVVAESIADFTGNPCGESQPSEPVHGFMTGGGTMTADGSGAGDQDRVSPGQTVTHAFVLPCVPGEQPPGNPNLLVHWKQTTGDTTFKLDTLTSSECSSEQSGSGNPHAGFDTMKGQGDGTCRIAGAADVPAHASWTFTDEGEPGVGQDELHVTIRDSATNGALCSLTADGTLDGGNHQAHELPEQAGGR